MAIIADGSGQVGGLAVRAASKAARIELFDSLGNKVTKPAGDTSLVTDEGIIVAGVDEGNTRHLRTDKLGSVANISYTTLLTELFEGSTISSSRWSVNTSGFNAVIFNALGLHINSSGATGANNGYLLRSLRSFVKMPLAPLHYKARAKFVPAANCTIELGFGDATIVGTAHTNGAYWQTTPGGLLQPVLTYNGVDITGAPVTGINYNNYYTWDIIVNEENVLFTIQDSSTRGVIAERTIKLPSAQAKPWAVTRLYAMTRVLISPTIAPAPPGLFIAYISCSVQDLAPSKSWGEQMAASGYGGGLNPVTFAQTTSWGNSAAPASATLSNVSAGYSTKDGFFQFAAVPGASTDYALFGFQVPIPYSFICTGLAIETWNTGAAVATTPTLLVWGLAYDLSALALSTAGAKMLIGAQELPIGTVPGSKAVSIDKQFSVPIIANSGRFITLTLRMPVATATASQIIQGMVNLRGYFE